MIILQLNVYKVTHESKYYLTTMAFSSLVSFLSANVLERRNKEDFCEIDPEFNPNSLHFYGKQLNIVLMCGPWVKVTSDPKYRELGLVRCNHVFVKLFIWTWKCMVPYNSISWGLCYLIVNKHSKTNTSTDICVYHH